MSTIQENIRNIQELITKFARRAKRKPTDVKLLAVSKTKPPEKIIEAYDAGLRAFGESYAQEAARKIAALRDMGYSDISWTFIGPIQSNKTAIIARFFDAAESVDRIKIARRLAAQRPDGLPPLKVLIQVNISGEEQKSGCSWEEIDGLAACVAASDRLELRGLMGVAENTTDEAEITAQFRRLAERLGELREKYPGATELSIGMTGDMGAAIACGSTEVRIGTAIFGAREYRRDGGAVPPGRIG